MALSWFIAYAVILAWVGRWAGRRLHTVEAYFLDNRRMHAVVVTGSILASWIGAGSTLATFNAAARDGISAFWWLGAPTVLTVAVLAILAPWIRRLSTVSTPELLAPFYGPGYGRLVRLVMVWYMMTLAASQAIALAKVLQPWLETSYAIALWIGLVATVVYTALGGYRSVVITDWIQWTLLMALIVLFFVHTWPLRETAAVTVESARWDPMRYASTHLWSVLSFTVAWVISPIAWQRIASIRNPRHVRGVLFGCAVIFGGVYTLIVVAGTWWGATHPTAATLADFMRQSLSPLGQSFATLALVAAIMSTLDTALNTGAYLTATALEAPSPNRSLRPVMALITVGLAVGAGLIASVLRDIITVLGLSSQILVTGLLVPILALRWTARPSALGAWLATIGGTGMALLGFLGEGLPVWPLWLRWPRSIVWGLVLSAMLFAVGTRLERGRNPRYNVVEK